MKSNKAKREINAIARELSYHKRSLVGLIIAPLVGAGIIIACTSQGSTEDTSAVTCVNSPCNTTFEVNVVESLSVSIAKNTAESAGDTGDFLRNKVTLSVASNNASGFNASMQSRNTTDLVNASGNNYTIKTLGQDSTNCSATSYDKTNFPANCWGYSSTTVGGNDTTYNAMSTSAISLLSAGAGTSTGSRDIYFGAKADNSKASGTYTGTVIFNVVTGAINENTNPIVPVDPARPSTDTSSHDGTAGTDNSTYTGDGTSTGVGISTSDGTHRYNGTTVSSTTTTSGSVTTTTTEVSGNDVTGSYQRPAGVTKSIGTTENIVQNSAQPIALAVAAGGLATAGVAFFILAKKRDDDDEEEEA